MFITRKAEKAWVRKTTTIRGSHFALDTTRKDTPYPGLSKAGPKTESVNGRRRPLPITDESTWGWARMMQFDRRHGFRPIE